MSKLIPRLLVISLPLVGGAPLPPDPIIIKDDGSVVYLGEHPTRRTTVVIVCIVYAFLLALAQGYRAGRIAGHRTRKSRLSDVLIFVQGFVCTAFLFAAAIGISGLGLSSEAQCDAIIRVCIAMYGTAKIAMTLFLLERVHIVRSAFIERFRDPIWIIGAITTLAGYGGIMGFEYIRPKSHLSLDNGKCMIGIQQDAAIAVIGVDAGLNFALTGIFIWLLRPTFVSHVHWPSVHGHKATKEHRIPSVLRLLGLKDIAAKTGIKNSTERNVRIMLIRNIIGSVLLLVNTIVNNAIYIVWGFAKMSHACLLMCLTEVVLGMLITQWLTMRAALDVAPQSRDVSSLYASNSTASPKMSPHSRRPTTESCRLEISTYDYDHDIITPISNAAYKEDQIIHPDIR